MEQNNIGGYGCYGGTLPQPRLIGGEGGLMPEGVSGLEQQQRLVELIQERESANIAAHFLAGKMRWEDIAVVDKSLAVAILISRDRVPAEEAFKMVYGEDGLVFRAARREA